MTIRINPIIRTGAFLLMMTCIIWFFASQVHDHWNQLSSLQIKFNWPWLAAGLLLVIVHYLIATLAWRMTLIANKTDVVSYVECIGLSNISQLTKYLPGKVWSYAIQMHLLKARKISKAHVASTNILMQISLLTSACLIGFAYIAHTKTLLPPTTARLLFFTLLFFYLCMVFAGTSVINILILLANRLLRRNIEAINISSLRIIQIHAINLAANFVYGVAGCLVALGVNLPLEGKMFGVLIAATLLSDAAGFVAIVAPGGIGIREGLMYTMLKPLVSIQFCFILPVVFRLATAASDLILGGTSLVLLRRFTKKNSAVTTD